MAGFAKAILISILAAASIVFLFNLAFFFPWYLEVIETAFQVSQMISTDNYLTYDNHDYIYSELKSKPIFKEKAGKEELKIEAYHMDGKSAKEENEALSLEYYYALDDEDKKPYVQMGNLVTVTVTATYPFQMQFLGESFEISPITVTFSMTTVTTKHYKDLDYDYGDYGVFHDDYDG